MPVRGIYYLEPIAGLYGLFWNSCTWDTRPRAIKAPKMAATVEIVCKLYESLHVYESGATGGKQLRKEFINYSYILYYCFIIDAFPFLSTLSTTETSY